MDSVQNVNGNSSRYQNMKKNSVKGAVIGGSIASTAGLAYTGAIYSIRKFGIKSFDLATKKDFILYLNDLLSSKFPKIYEIKNEKIKLTYSGIMKEALKVFKRPTTWIKLAGTGALIGGAIGLISSLGKHE